LFLNCMTLYHSVVNVFFLFGHLLVQTSSALVSLATVGVALFVHTCRASFHYVNKLID